MDSTFTPDTITVNGAEYARVRRPDRLSIHYMTDNHLFIPLRGNTLDSLLDHADAVASKHPYGSIGTVIVCEGDREIRRIGHMVHQHPNKPQEWQDGKARWKAAIEQDRDAMSLLSYHPTREENFDD
jgi:hypothetical protein